jgi:large subunit ribosomal protein L15
MKLHDLHPAEGSRRPRTRVGRGIAAGKGKTAGRGTKGQKARAGGSIPPWFEGGQTPLHMRIPKLRGFKNRFRTMYEIVNLGDIAQAIESGKLETGETPKAAKGKSGAPVTVNQELLRDAGLVRRLDRPLKVLAGGAEVTTALFVVADAFSKTARTQIEAAGGTVSVLEVPTESRPALGVDRPARRPRASEQAAEKAARPAAAPKERPAEEPKPKRAKAEKRVPTTPDATDESSTAAPAAANATDEATTSVDPTAALAPDGTEGAPAEAADGTDEAESGSPDR